MTDKLGQDLPDTTQEHDTIGAFIQPLEWFSNIHMARTIGDQETKQSLFTSCMVNDVMFLKEKYTEKDENENCTEAAISVLCQSSAFLFSQVASGVLTKDQLRTKIEEFITR